MSAQRLVARLGTCKLLLNIAQNAPKVPKKHTIQVPRGCRSMSSAFSSPRLDLTFQDNGMALVTMKSGDNRLHPEMMDQMHLVMDEIEKNPDCRAMITTGQDKFFSNGLDLEYVKSFTHKDRQLAEYLDKLNRLIVRVLTFPVPTVAALNGHAFAGGAVLALAHDLRVMREDKGWICLSEVKVNVRFPSVLLSIMRAKITSAPVRTQAILFAKRFTAQEALNSGLVDKVTDQSQLVESAKLLANEALGTDGLSRENLGLFKKDLYENMLRERQIHYT